MRIGTWSKLSIDMVCQEHEVMREADAKEIYVVPNDTFYKQWNCHGGYKLMCKLGRNIPPQKWGPINRLWAIRPCRTAGWMARLLIKTGDVETNPGPTTTHKIVWICYICRKQIHSRKLISIRCNMIEHWVHLRCAYIRLAQYTDTRTCHIHK